MGQICPRYIILLGGVSPRTDLRSVKTDVMNHLHSRAAQLRLIGFQDSDPRFQANY